MSRPSMVDLLEQREVWWAKEAGQLRQHRLDEMDADHLRRLRAWLLRQAESLQMQVLGQQEEVPEADQDAESWVRERPLYGRIVELLDHADRELTRTDLRVVHRVLKMAAADPMSHSPRQIAEIERVLNKVSAGLS